MTSKPNPYVISRVNKWITCEDADGPAGLAILVRQYITNAERDDLLTESGEIAQYTLAYMQAPTPEEKAALEEKHGGSPRDVERAFLAPFVIGWNVQAETVDGDVEDVPAPADGGVDVFDLIPAEHYSWIYNIVVRGYRAMGKAGSYREK